VGAQLVVQFGVDEMHLAEVGLGRVARDVCPDRAIDRLVPSGPRRGVCRATMARWPPSIRPGRRRRQRARVR
jgi:hypothetical protein